MERPFRDRRDAGRLLAEDLADYAGRPDVLVLALPRGGVPVAYEVARALDAPLDVFLVRKLGVPGHEELAMGAIATGGVRVLNEDVVRGLRIPPEVIDRVAAAERAELERRERAYRGDRPPPEVARPDASSWSTTGWPPAPACGRPSPPCGSSSPARIVVAVPVAAAATCEEFRRRGRRGRLRRDARAVLRRRPWYEDFSQTSDDEVRDLLGRAAASGAARGPGDDADARTANPGRRRGADDGRDTARARGCVGPVPAGSRRRSRGTACPTGARGVVLFAHGSGSSRHSSRNRFVAGALRAGGLATLLIDLLTPEEEAVDLRTAHLRFDIGLLAGRLVGATDWLAQRAGRPAA